jgi:prepilin-type N-terminal cleavage/methylation domain-containing protein
MVTSIRKQKAFSILELVVAIAVIGTLLTVAIPQFIGRSAAAERQRFVEELNLMLNAAYINAIDTHTSHRIIYDFKQSLFSVEHEVKTGEYESLGSALAHATCDVPVGYIFEQFIINNKDEMATSSERSTAWFFLSENGVPQEVRLTVALDEGKGKMWLVLNPFLVQFIAYDTQPS